MQFTLALLPFIFSGWPMVRFLCAQQSIADSIWMMAMNHFFSIRIGMIEIVRFSLFDFSTYHQLSS